MRALAAAALAAGLLLLTGCSGTTPAPHAHAAATPSAAAPPAPAYSDAQACAAFHRATTTGAPGGQNTLSWLLSQEGHASPALKTALTRFVNAWTDAVDVKRIGRATRAVRRLCG